jgi:hypothetical protein
MHMNTIRGKLLIRVARTIVTHSPISRARAIASTRKSIVSAILVLFALLVTSLPALSQTQYVYSGLLSSAGVQGAGTASTGNLYVIPAGTLSEPCADSGTLYFTVGATFGAVANAYYATALAAIASGQQVLIGYNIGAGNICTVNTFNIQ